MQETARRYDAVDLEAVLRWLTARGLSPEPRPSETEPVEPTQGSPSEDFIIAFAPLDVQHATETYFDTPDWRFHKAGHSARLRTVDENSEAIIKPLEAKASPTEGPTELRCQLPTADFRALVESESRAGAWARSLLGKMEPEALYALRTRRRPFAILAGEQTIGEIALEELEFSAPSKPAPIQMGRVEIEVLPSHGQALAPLIPYLVETFHLTPAEATNFELGLKSLEITPESTPDAVEAVVSDEPTMGDLAFTYLRKAFLRFLRNEPGTRIGEDIEALHDVRVSARRMRVILDFFEPVLPVRARSLAGELSWIGSRLGDVRDLDIQLAEIDSWSDQAESKDLEAFRQLKAELDEKRAKARSKMLRSMETKRYREMVSRLTRTLKAGPPRTAVGAQEAALAAFPSLIEAPFRAAVNRAWELSSQSPAKDYHRFRIRCKELRYCLEAGMELYGPPASSYIKTLVNLQDLLGRHQDIQVGIGMLEELIEAEASHLPARTLSLVRELSERSAREAAELRGQIRQARTRLEGQAWSRLKDEMAAAQPKTGGAS